MRVEEGLLRGTWRVAGSRAVNTGPKSGVCSIRSCAFGFARVPGRALAHRTRRGVRGSCRCVFAPRGLRRLSVFPRSRRACQRAYSGAPSSRACFSLPKTLRGALSRLLGNSSRRPARIFGPNSALLNLAVALLWRRFRASTATQSLASLAFGQLVSARISAPGSVGSISATC
jgi:hypothetical protein